MGSAFYSDVTFGEGVSIDVRGQVKMRTTDVTPAIDSRQFSLFCDEYSGTLVCPQLLMNDGVADQTLKLFQGDAIVDATDAASAITQQNLLFAHLRLMGILKP